MLWLFFSTVVLLLSLLAENVKKNKLHNFLVFSMIFVLSYMTGLSGQVSIDHENYVDIYDAATGLSYFKDFSLLSMLIGGGFVEPGYALLNIICHYLGFGRVGFFVTVAFITNALVVLSIFKFPRPTIGILLFIVSTHYYYETNLVRQMMAVAGFLYCAEYLYEGKVKQYIISVFILSMFHTSALLLVGFALFKFINTQERIKTANIVLCVVWLFSVYALITGQSLGVISELLNNVFGNTVYNRYTSGDKHLDAGYGVAYIYNLFTLLSFIMYSFSKTWNRDKYIYIVLFQIGCILVNFASSVETLTRFALYFSIFQFVVLPYMTVSHQKVAKLSSGPIIPQAVFAFLILYYGVYILGYSFIVNGGTLLGKEMYSITNFFV